MIGLDTNILARLIVADDAAQVATARRKIKELRRQQQHLYISNLVLCELVWVLTSRYEFDRQQVLDALDRVILGTDFTLEAGDWIYEVIEKYEVKNTDFADILIGLTHEHSGCKTTLTFDKQAAKLKAFTLLK